MFLILSKFSLNILYQSDKNIFFVDGSSHNKSHFIPGTSFHSYLPLSLSFNTNDSVSFNLILLPGKSNHSILSLKSEVSGLCSNCAIFI
jgi:hypothetical protein